MSEKKYIPEGVWLTCDSGATPSRLTVTNKSSDIYGVPVATEGDKIPGYNIKSFGACKTCPARVCTMPAPIMWLDPQPGVYHGSFRLLKDDSTIMCMFGGPIKIHYTFAAAMAYLDLVAAENEVKRLDNEVERLENEAEMLQNEADRLEREAEIIQEHFDATLAAAQEAEANRPWYEKAGSWLKDTATDGVRMSMNMPGNPFAIDIPFTDWDNKFKDGFAEGVVNWAASMPELAYQIYQDPMGVATGVKDMAVDGFNWAKEGDNWANAASGAWDWASDGDNWMEAGQWIIDNPEGVGKAVGEVAPDVALTILGGAGAYRKAAAEALEQAAKEAAEKAAREAAERAAKEAAEKAAREAAEEAAEKAAREAAEEQAERAAREAAEEAADELPEVVVDDAPVLKGRRPATPEHPVRDANGDLTEYGKWYYERPSGYRAGVRDDVWDEAAGNSIDGQVRDPLTGDIMSPDDPWDMGHRPGYEFRKHRESAADRGIGREQFLDEHNNPDHYRPELPSSNRSHADEAPDDIYLGD